MNVLMFGWEYPPHIAGGPGTACEGLTRALAEQGVALTFVVPRAFGDEDAAHMRLVGVNAAASEEALAQGGSSEPATRYATLIRTETWEVPGIMALVVDSNLTPYGRPRAVLHETRQVHQREQLETVAVAEAFAHPVAALAREQDANVLPAASHYGGDLFSEVARYARCAAQIARMHFHDLIHAHDWMTWPAALEARKVSGKPVVLHVHSLEYDRSGEHVNEDINRIERAALQAADHIVAVSHYTKTLVARMHGIDPARISVVHNGVTRAEAEHQYHLEGKDANPMVLFMGRITFQKGPEYFVRAAKRVLQRQGNVRFVMAGSGDMIEPMRQLTAELGIESSFEFPGFLRGAQRERYFSLADVYVMPSVSEPFGITPLEAMAYDVPVIISRQSGVSEVLRHALKVDFWDVDRLAELLLALLRHEVLCNELTRMAQRELLHLHWQAAAQKLAGIFKQVSAVN